MNAFRTDARFGEAAIVERQASMGALQFAPNFVNGCF
jgi:hypothetical protein